MVQRHVLRFYVYVYRDPRPGKNLEPFYVGKGTIRSATQPLVRAFRHLGSPVKNPFFKNVLNKIKDCGLKPIIEVADWCLNEEDAFVLERQLIKEFGRRQRGEGPLVNLTDGGEGISGHIPDAEWCAAQSERSKSFWKNPEYRSKVIERVNAARNKPAHKKQISNRFKSLWETPEYRAKQVANITEINSREDVRRRKSETMKKRWQDPVYLEKWTDARNKMLASFEYQSNLAASRKPHSEETKAKMRASHRARIDAQLLTKPISIKEWKLTRNKRPPKGSASAETKAKMSEAHKLRWQRQQQQLQQVA